ncbi:MAG TPA: hypothetical protein VHS53_13810, partial [Mucilaginibacter sp.]|nr:hypothetical protein [Mucilaginibacter sp.]
MKLFYHYRDTFYKFILNITAGCACLLLSVTSALAQDGAHLQWKLNPQSETAGTGLQVSVPGFKSAGWINAVVPGTVFYSYVKAGKEKDPDYADNIYHVDNSKYDRPFWYRTEFSAPQLQKDKRLWLKFNGINKTAE